MEAFSDAVIAILITVMVLELHIPHGTTWAALHHSLPTLLTYVLSFVYLGIYWNNHHHMLTLTGNVDGLVLWANMHLLFWLSLVPFATGWMGENHFAQVPTSAYGIVLLGAGVAYFILQTVIIRRQGNRSLLAAAVGRDVKGKLSPVVYVVGIAGAFLNRWIAVTAYVLVALMWLIPDPRVERTINARTGLAEPVDEA
jgi:uncharacterized membrane protein